MQKVQFTETVLRDANQSLIATRMKFSEFQPILETLDKAGYYSLECWGGATYDACLRFLNEDPWERLRTIKLHCPNTKLQMLFRGQNMLGYRHYADDVVDMFVKKSIENGSRGAIASNISRAPRVSFSLLSDFRYTVFLRAP